MRTKALTTQSSIHTPVAGRWTAERRALSSSSQRSTPRGDDRSLGNVTGDVISDVVFRGGPYDGTTDANDPLTDCQDLSIDTDDVFRYKRSTDRVERLHGKLFVVYEYVGQVFE
jgi:hypothetical protein